LAATEKFDETEHSDELQGSLKLNYENKVFFVTLKPLNALAVLAVSLKRPESSTNSNTTDKTVEKKSNLQN
jgi:hypothetical protein